MSIIIVVNAGHGGSDPGAVGSVQEKDVNLDVARRVVEKLNAAGYDARLTRNSDIHMYLTDRADIANAAGAALYLSVHHNGGGGAYACDICYPGSTEGVRLANLFLEKWCGLSGLQNAGVIQSDDTDVTASNMPAVIGEAWFVDNAAHANNYVNGNWAELEATAWLNTVNAYFGNADQQPAASTTASAPAATPAASNKYGFTSIFNSSNYLAIGSEGEDVAQLQRDLNFCGYRDQDGNRFVEDGDFGEKTKYGVECVERFHDIDDDGEYGQNADISLMTEVADIQTALVKAGYNITVDGASGQESCRALNDFQLRNGLEVDCSCGDATRTKLGI